MAKNSLERYTHYYERWATNQSVCSMILSIILPAGHRTAETLLQSQLYLDLYIIMKTITLGIFVYLCSCNIFTKSSVINKRVNIVIAGGGT